MSKLIINVETGEETLRELNSEELAQQDIDELRAQEVQLAHQAEAEAKANAKAALLAQLGITAEQAKLLLS